MAPPPTKKAQEDFPPRLLLNYPFNFHFIFPRLSALSRISCLRLDHQAAVLQCRVSPLGHQP